MKNGKHTPGPWHASTRAVQCDKGTDICSLSGWKNDSVSSANARLIAAAPDLLEALKRLLDENDEFLTLQGRINLARAAIAKAEGAEA